MTRTFIVSSILVIAFAAPALAGSPPVSKKRTVTNVEMSCANLGDRGESLNRDGRIGCRNSQTGAAVTCTLDGQCTEYAPDPRWRKIRDALEGNRLKQQQVPL